MTGCRVKAARLLHGPSLHPLSMPPESLENMRIASVRRRGKLAVFDLRGETQAGPSAMVIHLRMTGALLPQPFNSSPNRHTRCIFSLESENAFPVDLFFDDIRTFGKILIASPAILEQWPFWRNLGPEPLTLDAATLQKRLAGRKKLKSALLDQAVIAGIGNIYADESLFQAALNPLRESGSLDFAESARLLAALQDVLSRSIEQCGSSIRDYKDANGNAGAFQNSFKVYGRGGKKCGRCHTVLQKIKVGGRATVFCPQCQK